MSNKGYNETLTVPINHKVVAVNNSKAYDSQLRGLNGGLLSLATSLGQTRTEIISISKAQTLQDNRLDNIEKMLAENTSMLNKVHNMLHHVNESFAKFNVPLTQDSKKKKPIVLRPQRGLTAKKQEVDMKENGMKEHDVKENDMKEHDVKEEHDVKNEQEVTNIKSTINDKEAKNEPETKHQVTNEHDVKENDVKNEQETKEHDVKNEHVTENVKDVEENVKDVEVNIPVEENIKVEDVTPIVEVKPEEVDRFKDAVKVKVEDVVIKESSRDNNLHISVVEVKQESKPVEVKQESKPVEVKQESKPVEVKFAVEKELQSSSDDSDEELLRNADIEFSLDDDSDMQEDIGKPTPEPSPKKPIKKAPVAAKKPIAVKKTVTKKR